MAPELYQIILNDCDVDGCVMVLPWLPLLCVPNRYDYSCDVWSLGCVLFDMATHSNKFIWVSAIVCVCMMTVQLEVLWSLILYTIVFEVVL